VYKNTFKPKFPIVQRQTSVRIRVRDKDGCDSSIHIPVRSVHFQSSYFGNVMTNWKFIVNNRTDTLKTDISLFFTMTKCQSVRSRSLTHCINYKYVCLIAYWQWKLANERARISTVIVKVYFCLFQQQHDGSRHSTASVASEESENEQSNEVNEQETLAQEN